VMASRCFKRDVLDEDRQRFVDGDRVQYGSGYRPVARRPLPVRKFCLALHYAYILQLAIFFPSYFVTATDSLFCTFH
jgi:hypothetical protein